MTDAKHSKTCPKCGPLPATNEYFYGLPRAGSIGRCRVCIKAYGKSYRESQGGKAKAAAWRRRPENAAKIDARRRAWAERNAERIQRQREANREAKRRYDREYQIRNREIISARRRADWLARKEQIKAIRSTPAQIRKRSEWNRRYKRDRWRSDARYRLNISIGNALRDALSGRRPGRWAERVCGYSVAELRSHLESQFLAGMSWDNHGTLWEIDHIRPLASFSYASVFSPEVRQAWGLSNLRPLHKELNRAKGASLAA